MTTLAECRSERHHGTYWAYRKHGCRCLNAAVANSIYIARRRVGDPIELVRDATGAVRIARGLAVHGYTGHQIAEASGIGVRTIYHLYAGKDTITTRKYARLRDACRRLMAAPPPTGTAALRSRALAARNGWVPLAAWDDVDDPDAVPDLGEGPEVPDEWAVAELLAGRLTVDRVGVVDAVEAARRLAAEGLRFGQIRYRLGLTNSQTRRLLEAAE